MDSTGNHDTIGGVKARHADMVLCPFPPFSRVVADVEGSQPEQASAAVTTEHVRKLDALSKADCDALSAVLRAAWALVLRCYTGQDDVCFGFQPGGDDPCNVLVTRFALDNTTTVSELLDRAKTGPCPPGNQTSFDTAVIMRGGSDCTIAGPKALVRVSGLLSSLTSLTMS